MWTACVVAEQPQEPCAVHWTCIHEPWKRECLCAGSVNGQFRAVSSAWERDAWHGRAVSPKLVLTGLPWTSGAGESAVSSATSSSKQSRGASVTAFAFVFWFLSCQPRNAEARMVCGLNAHTPVLEYSNVSVKKQSKNIWSGMRVEVVSCARPPLVARRTDSLAAPSNPGRHRQSVCVRISLRVGGPGRSFRSKL